MSVVERAFEIARSGVVADLAGLRLQLRLERAEGIDLHLSSGPSLRRQLREALRWQERARGRAGRSGGIGALNRLFTRIATAAAMHTKLDHLIRAADARCGQSSAWRF